MYVDSQLQFSDAQAVTAAAASTNYLNLSAVRDVGTGRDLYVVVSVQTTLEDGGSNTGTDVYLRGDSDGSSFTPDGSQLLFSFDDGDVAGTVKFAKIDPGSLATQYQYVQLYFDPQGANLTAGKFDAFITTDIQKYKAYADNRTITSPTA